MRTFCVVKNNHYNVRASKEIKRKPNLVFSILFWFYIIAIFTQFATINFGRTMVKATGWLTNLIISVLLSRNKIIKALTNGVTSTP